MGIDDVLPCDSEDCLSLSQAEDASPSPSLTLHTVPDSDPDGTDTDTHPGCQVPPVTESLFRFLAMFLSRRIDVPPSMVVWLLMPIFCPLYWGYIYFEQPGLVFTYFVYVPGRGLIFELTTFFFGVYIYLAMFTPMIGLLVATSEAVLPGVLPDKWRGRSFADHADAIFREAMEPTPHQAMPSCTDLSHARDSILKASSASSAATREMQMATESLYTLHSFKRGRVLDGLTQLVPDTTLYLYIFIAISSCLFNCVGAWSCFGWWSVFVSPFCFPFLVYACYIIYIRLRRRSQIRQEWKVLAAKA
ncbi:hypothetical protein KIPB_000820 [Kipferlia bialata]|uniref:Uncharacterized protein n=1 Tax=Kipferlia bialata TaxID=797122 RepID=A0A9K3CPR3_9EUKA|nr:hypothetical protein KIPB_000820 [Kipferlia bialata]|eukprot:g820.t1